MKKLIVPFIIVALVLACLALLDKSCQNDAEIAKWKADYAAAKKANDEASALSLAKVASLEAEQATLQGMVDSANTVIAAKDSTIAIMRYKVAESNAATAALRTEVQPVLDANPKVAELVASLDAGVALRDGLIAEQQSLILTLKDRIALGDRRLENQVAISAEWKAMYEREAALRTNCEKGIGLYEKQRRSSRIWAAVGKYGPPVAFVAGMLLSK